MWVLFVGLKRGVHIVHRVTMSQMIDQRLTVGWIIVVARLVETRPFEWANRSRLSGSLFALVTV